MAIFTENNYKKLYKLFLVFYLCFTCLERIMILKNYIPLSVIQLIYNSLAVVGVLLVLKNIFSYKENIKNRTYLLLLVFCFISILSCLINIKYGFSDNIKTLIWLAIQINVFYPATFILGKDEIQKSLYYFLMFINVIWSIAIIISIYQFITQIHFSIVINNYTYYQGFYKTRLFGTFIDPNFAGMMSFIFIIANIVLIVNKKAKYLSIFAIIMNFLYTILSGSRTVEICEIIVVFLAIFILFLNKYNLKNHSYIKSVVIFLISILISFSCIPINTIGQDALAQLPVIYKNNNKSDNHKNTNLKKKTSTSKRKNKQKNVLKRTDTNSENVSNNRFYIWKSYLDTMQGDLILGKSPRNAINKITEEYPNSYISQTKYETHNGYLSVFVYTGILGSIIMLIVLVRLFLFAMDLIFRKHYFNSVFLGCVMVCAVILISTFFLTETFFVNTFGSTSFWLLAGYVEKEKNDLSQRLV